uniref:Uncharacterized protein n=1 Tax=Caenorhabditis japonica TaxID=281687 RepID=A0A8R1IC07_CAEJA
MIRKKVVGDCKFLASLYNHPGQSSSQPCHLCRINYRTHGSNKACLGQFNFDESVGSRNLRSYNVEGEPLVQVELDNCVIPPLHCLQGVTQSYGINFFLAEANRIDFGDDLPETIPQQHRMLKDL